MHCVPLVGLKDYPATARIQGCLSSAKSLTQAQLDQACGKPKALPALIDCAAT
jgi:hypothetical protein